MLRYLMHCQSGDLSLADKIGLNKRNANASPALGHKFQNSIFHTAGSYRKA